MTGRGNDFEATNLRKKIVSYNIKKLNKSFNILVDVGCGDGSFLEDIEKFSKLSIGVLPTNYEARKLSKIISNKKIKIIQGITNKLPFKNNSVDFILVNCVIHGVGFDSSLVNKSLVEFKRVIKKKGYLYVGEIPETNELKNRNYGQSIFKYLIWTLVNKNFQYFLSQLSNILIAMFTDKNYIIMPTNMFSENKQSFISRLNKTGFRVTNVLNSNNNKQINLNHNKILKRRLDYICIKK